MTKDRTAKLDDPEQSKRFVELAKEAGASAESPIFDKVLRKVAATPRNGPEKTKRPRKA